MKVSAEIGHACSGESLMYEPAASLNALRLMGISDDIMHAVLVDDTSGFPEGLGPFLSRLNHLNLPHLLVMQESSFEDVACLLMDMIPSKAITVKPYRYTATKAFCLEGSCNIPLMREDACGRRTPLRPLLSAAWSACRLGMLEWPTEGLVSGEYHKADSIVNVLPWHLEGIEKIGERILLLAGMKSGRMSVNFY